MKLIPSENNITYWSWIYLPVKEIYISFGQSGFSFVLCSSWLIAKLMTMSSSSPKSSVTLFSIQVLTLLRSTLLKSTLWLKMSGQDLSLMSFLFLSWNLTFWSSWVPLKKDAHMLWWGYVYGRRGLFIFVSKRKTTTYYEWDLQSICERAKMSNTTNQIYLKK